MPTQLAPKLSVLQLTGQSLAAWSLDLNSAELPLHGKHQRTDVAVLQDNQQKRLKMSGNQQDCCLNNVHGANVPAVHV